jgi:50S ribosomal protein L16 3-hydroxylase
MRGFASRALARIHWTRRDVADFLGEYLSLPKAHVVFRGRPGRRRLALAMVHLDLKTQLLYSGRRFFINGEAVTVPQRAAAALRRLADERCAGGDALVRAQLEPLISEWRRRGYLLVE